MFKIIIDVKDSSTLVGLDNALKYIEMMKNTFNTCKETILTGSGFQITVTYKKKKDMR